MILVCDTSELEKPKWLNAAWMHENGYETAVFGEWKDWEELMVELNYFPSRSQARKAGRTGPLPKCGGWHKVGKKKFYFMVAR